MLNLDTQGKVRVGTRSIAPTPPTNEVVLYADTNTKHLVQIDETGKAHDLAAMIQQDSVGFDPTLLYNFDTTVEGWTVNASNTITWTAQGGGAIDVVDLNAAAVMIMRSPAGLSINGGKYPRVKAMVTRLSGSGTTCSCLYTTGGHSESVSFIKTIPIPPTFAIGETVVIDFDMENLTSGGTDWIDSTITRIRIDLGNLVNVDDSFRVHWVAIGRNAPVQPATASVAGAANQVQYNSGSGTFAANSNFTIDAATNTQASPNIMMDSALLDSALPSALDIKTGAKKNALILPRHLDEFGAEYLSSPAFWTKNFSMFTPNTGTSGTGLNLGGAWTSNGTVTHPNPATTNKGTIQHRTRYANIATTQNQILGPIPTAQHLKFLRGHASAKMGGYLYFSRFVVEFPASTVRIFAGMNIAIGGTHIQTDADTVGIMGFRHITTDPLSGSGAWAFYSNNGTVTNVAITPSVALASGQLYDAWIYAPPGASDPVLYKLVLLEATADTVIAEGQITSGQAFTNLSCPQFLMSNGTANVTVNTTANNLCNITCVALN